MFHHLRVHRGVYSTKRFSIWPPRASSIVAPHDNSPPGVQGTLALVSGIY